jgi:hypothetical protein
VAGYEYIAGIIPGGEFISRIKIISNNRETKEKVDAELNAHISDGSQVPSGSIEAGFGLKATFSQLAKNRQVQIEARCYRKGGDGLLVTNPEDALKYALNFPAYLRESPSILQVICKPYQDLRSFPRGYEVIDMMTLQKQQRPLQELFDIFQQKSQTIAQIDQILLNPMQFHGVEEDVLRNGKRKLKDQLDKIAESATKYANNPHDIRVDSSDFPPISLALPARRLVELKSGLGIDYTNLSDLLFAKKWQEADEETARVMLAVAKQEKEGGLRGNGIIDNFPCEDLRTIDQLWVKYSNGRFGFSVQKRIYQRFGEIKTYDDKIWYAFCDKVGWMEDRGKQRMTWVGPDTWRNEGGWNHRPRIFDIKAPEGHLPSVIIRSQSASFIDFGPIPLLDRIKTCKL